MDNLHPDDEGFFSPHAFDAEESVKGHRIAWYSGFLGVMAEESLWQLSRRDPSAMAYRFLWLPTYDNSACVRIVKTEESIALHAVLLNGEGGYYPGEIALKKTIPLSREQWDRFQHHLEVVNFWSLPTVKNDRGLDGDRLILEAAEKGRYHIVDRFSPRTDAYVDLCGSMLFDLAGLDLRETWDPYRY